MILSDLIARLQSVAGNHRIVLSSETGPPETLISLVELPDILQIHKELNHCRVFWGNSGTMAAEAAVLGIPAVYIGEEKLSYIRELEAYGLLYHYTPERLGASFEKVEELLAKRTDMAFQNSRMAMLKEKEDLTEFLYAIVRTCNL